MEIVSDTKPIPMEKHDIILAHALAGEYMGKSLIIDSLLNFGRLNEFIEEYDITFDEQTMESDILELSNNKEFEDLNDYIKLARNHKYSTGYIGHYENYSIFLQGLRIKFKKGGYF